ncbi:PREDICTED: uncharacterized protein LOC106807235 [Priapulus caudatus]|uniref:Uncharacterized protein LOC106807235 n=1 Tax=Priapulus caudatus TaxID=37621 RepID=A0ABM1DYI7_PRICU|nr:PREDICTED: uncharacterized protein LOC106807235 [Priapulus caudatus]
MSVSDPLLKRFKGLVLLLRNEKEPIRDHNSFLQQFSETLEEIFRRGLKHFVFLAEPGAIFGFNKRDYWNWIESLPDVLNVQTINPALTLAVSTVKNCKKVKTNQGRGRLFIRFALARKSLHLPVKYIHTNTTLLEYWYDPNSSIIGNEILSEIFLSLLEETKQIIFNLNIKNSSFLDETWTIPVYKQFEFVPCRDLGIHLSYIKGRAVVAAVDIGSVAAEDNKIETGDVLDELYGVSLNGVRKGQLQTITADFSRFRANYLVKYVGRVDVGEYGGVAVIENGIQEVLRNASDIEKQEVYFELGETDVTVTLKNSCKVLLKHSYTEISSCGRRVDSVDFFAYIAGETSCSLAKKFVCYVFEAACDEESKTILCAIAQGFGRTHWFV